MVIGQSSVAVKDKTQALKDLGIPSPDAKETTPSVKEPTPKTYTETELSEEKEKAVHSALMRAGRDWKTMELERDNLASQLKDIKSANDKLTLQIDELASENPDKFDVIKKGRELDEQEQRIKQDRQSLDAEKQNHQGAITLANETLREIAIWDIVEEFEGGNAEMLKGLADTLKTEDIRKVAETLWEKKIEAPPKLKLDSGIIVGGLSEQTIRESYRNNPNDPKAKADYLAWRRKKGI
mgnify:CR=1 FL=1